METIFITAGILALVLYAVSQSLAKGMGTVGAALQQIGSVSYTHLTLPTILLV